MRILSKIGTLFLTLLLLGPGVAQAVEGTDIQDATASMLEAELNFARSSEQEGTQQAFLKFLAPDSIGFFPGPSSAKKLLGKRKVRECAPLAPVFRMRLAGRGPRLHARPMGA